MRSVSSARKSNGLNLKPRVGTSLVWNRLGENVAPVALNRKNQNGVHEQRACEYKNRVAVSSVI